MTKTWRGISILLVVLLGAVPGLGGAPAAEAQEPTVGEAEELRDLVEELFASAEAGDDAAIDRITCLGDLLHARLEREEALGLVADAEAPELVEARREEARSGVYAFVAGLRERGGEIESVDVSRVAVSSLDASQGDGETVAGEEEEELAVTGAGILGVKMLTSERVVDVVVTRLGGRWCLDAGSMQ